MRVWNWSKESDQFRRAFAQFSASCSSWRQRKHRPSRTQCSPSIFVSFFSSVLPVFVVKRLWISTGIEKRCIVFLEEYHDAVLIPGVLRCAWLFQVSRSFLRPAFSRFVPWDVESTCRFARPGWCLGCPKRIEKSHQWNRARILFVIFDELLSSNLCLVKRTRTILGTCF